MTSKRVHFKSHENDSTNSNNSSGGSNSSNNLITVGVRVRPLNDKEKAQGNHNSIKINERNNEIIINDKQNKLNSFTCDFIITDQTSSSTSYQSNSIQDNQQQYVYEQVGKPLLDRAFDGYNVSIFAYGQTGSGKTYSMIGTSGQPGLIPRFFDELFKKKQQRDQIVSSTHIEFSYYEIYNEKIYDLLGSTPQPSISNSNNKSNQIGSSPMVVGNATGTSNSRSLQIRENPNTGPYIVGLLTLSASSAADAKLWLDIGNKRRATACTNMNQKSSRSHSVFQINLTQMLEHSNLPPQAKQQQRATTTTTTGNSLLQLVTSKINLVDLAGSERINTAFGSSNNTSNSYSSFASSNTSNQSRFKESTCINKSLLTLGKIICLLSDREISSSTASITNNKYLPYRESVLTWLLKESLGGNAKTAMLATVNSSSFFLDETLCTLRYAAKTACIKNEACLNRNFRQKYIDEFGRECEMNLIMPPMTTSMTGLPIHHSRSTTADALEKSNELELTIKQMEKEWKEKLEEAERLKQKEINDLEKSLIVLYENETRAQNCCLINLNEDPSLSEKLIYLLKSQSNNKENNEETTATLVGSDKNLVNIHLTGPLIASVHCRIICKSENALMNYYIEQMDKNYVTYLNGEVIDGNKKIFRQLFHGDRIIFGGSHFFRFNNPLSNNLINNSKQTMNTNLNDNFKDYQFAKNEIERKQNEIIESKLSEALSKCKQDGDLKIKELEKKYEKNIENIVSKKKIKYIPQIY
jgi:kinesin family member 14